MASDHAGSAFKSELKEILATELGTLCVVHDLGASVKDGSVDYPVYAQKLSHEVLRNNGAMGIGICGSGLGISMACNRFKGIRAALLYDSETAQLAKMHNNANVLCFGARKMSAVKAFTLIQAFLAEKYEGGRHERRLQLLDEITQEN